MTDRWFLTTSPLALALTVTLVACGGNSSAPTQPSSDNAVPIEIDTSTSTPAPDTFTPPETSFFDLGFDLPVGTRPGFEGSPFSANSFPLNEMASVLPRDAIPAITNPTMVRQDNVDYLSDNDLVFGIVINGDARAYPHNIGWWHEIGNDVVGGHPVSITFCPLTGTGLVFDGALPDGRRLDLGVSGLLYNTNLVMFDRRNDTLYPQIYAASITGDTKGEALALMPVVETTWSAWKRLYPETRVIARGPYPRTRYTEYPYGNYRTDNRDFLFSIRPSLSTNINDYAIDFPAKGRVLGVRIDAEARAYPFEKMGSQRVVNDVLGGLEIAVVFDAGSEMIIPYSRRLDGQVLSFSIEDDGSFPFSLRDAETGSLWDIRGRAIEGELKGQQLTQVPAHNAMWFAWVTFWPNTDVWMP